VTALRVIIQKEVDMRRLILVPLFLAVVLAMINPCAYAMKIRYAFVFADRFPDEAERLGFSQGNVVQVGAMVKAGDSPITEATATNLDTGLVLNLAPRQIGAAYTNLLFLHRPFPPLDPGKHTGVWEVRLKDEKGNEAVAKTHRFDVVGKLPYVGNIEASGNPVAPKITWSALKREGTPSKCKIGYRVRLLKDVSNQFYRSKKLLSDPKHQIPEGILTPDIIPYTYVRIEAQCWDKDDKDHPVAVELKSETFRSLEEALRQ
jgi:hypothetical protein